MTDSTSLSALETKQQEAYDAVAEYMWDVGGWGTLLDALVSAVEARVRAEERVVAEAVWPLLSRAVEQAEEIAHDADFGELTDGSPDAESVIGGHVLTLRALRAEIDALPDLERVLASGGRRYHSYDNGIHRFPSGGRGACGGCLAMWLLGLDGTPPEYSDIARAALNRPTDVHLGG